MMGLPFRGTRRAQPRPDSDHGASLVEFALVAPLLFLLLFGMIEFGWLVAQNLEVNHIAREVGRVASVGDPDGGIAGVACGGAIASIDSVVMSPGSADAGDTATVTVTAPVQQISGLFGWAVAGNGSFQSTVEVRMEQPFTWGGAGPC